MSKDVGVSPEDAKGLGELVGWISGDISEKLNGLTGAISGFFSSLGWFEWVLILFIIGISMGIYILKKKMEYSKNVTRTSLYGGRRRIR